MHSRARDVMDFVEIVYERLPALVDVEKSMRNDVELLDEIGRNIYHLGKVEAGNFELVAKEADLVIRIHRQYQMPFHHNFKQSLCLEPRHVS